MAKDPEELTSSPPTPFDPRGVVKSALIGLTKRPASQVGDIFFKDWSREIAARRAEVKIVFIHGEPLEDVIRRLIDESQPPSPDRPPLEWEDLELTAQKEIVAKLFLLFIPEDLPEGQKKKMKACIDTRLIQSFWANGFNTLIELFLLNGDTISDQDDQRTYVRRYYFDNNDLICETTVKVLTYISSEGEQILFDPPLELRDKVKITWNPLNESYESEYVDSSLSHSSYLFTNPIEAADSKKALEYCLRTNDATTFAALLARFPTLVEGVYESNRNILHLAFETNATAIILYLKQSSPETFAAQLDVRDRSNHTPLQLAMGSRDGSGWNPGTILTSFSLKEIRELAQKDPPLFSRDDLSRLMKYTAQNPDQMSAWQRAFYPSSDALENEIQLAKFMAQYLESGLTAETAPMVLPLYEAGWIDDAEIFGILDIIDLEEESSEIILLAMPVLDYNALIDRRKEFAKSHFDSVFSDQLQEFEESREPLTEAKHMQQCVDDWLRGIEARLICINGKRLDEAPQTEEVRDFLAACADGSGATDSEKFARLQQVWRKHLFEGRDAAFADQVIPHLTKKLHQHAALESISQAATRTFSVTPKLIVREVSRSINITISDNNDLLISTTRDLEITEDTETVVGNMKMEGSTAFSIGPSGELRLKPFSGSVYHSMLDKYFASSHRYTDEEIILSADGYLLEQLKLKKGPTKINLSRVSSGNFEFLLKHFTLEELLANNTLSSTNKALLLAFNQEITPTLIDRILEILPKGDHAKFLAKANVPDEIKIGIVSRKLAVGEDKFEAIKGLRLNDIRNPEFMNLLSGNFTREEFFGSKCSDSLKLELLKLKGGTTEEYLEPALLGMLKLDDFSSVAKAAIAELFDFKDIVLSKNEKLPKSDIIREHFPDNFDTFCIWEKLGSNPELLEIFQGFSREDNLLVYIMDKFSDGKLQPYKLLTLLFSEETRLLVITKTSEADEYPSEYLLYMKKTLFEKLSIREKMDLCTSYPEALKYDQEFETKYKIREIAELSDGFFNKIDPLQYIMKQSSAEKRQLTLFKHSDDVFFLQKEFYRKRGSTPQEAEKKAYEDLAKAIECILLTTKWQTGLGGERVKINRGIEGNRLLFDRTPAPKEIRVPKHVKKMLDVLKEGEAATKPWKAVVKEIYAIGTKAGEKSSFFRKKETHDFYRTFAKFREEAQELRDDGRPDEEDTTTPGGPPH